MSGISALRTLRGPVLAALLAGGLGLARLDQPNLWIDEIYTARWTRMSAAGLIASLRTDLHPPLYFLLERVATRALGESEMGLRLLSVLAGIAAVLVWHWAFRPALGSRVALGAACVLAAMPEFGLYTRMARYYALATLFAGIAHGLFARLESEEARLAGAAPAAGLPASHAWPGLPRARSTAPIGAWALYSLTVAAMLYTSYAAICLPLAHGALLLVRRPGRAARHWAMAMAAAAALFLPWLPAFAHQLGTAMALPPSAISGAARLALMPAYQIVALTSSELVPPWSVIGAIGFLAGIVALILGIPALHARAGPRTTTATALAATLIAVALIGVFTRATPFVAAPARLLFLWPFAAALMASALLDPRLSKPLRIGLIAALGLAWAIGWSNLYSARDFLNPIYLTPGREAAHDLAQEMKSGDLLLAEDDTGIPYYLAREDFRAAWLDPVDSLAAAHALEERPAHVVWARLARDGSAKVRPAANTRALLRAWGRYRGERGYLALDPVLRRIKARLLGHETESSRLVIERYDVEPSNRGRKKTEPRYRF